jgi:hypothetical protein
VTTVATPLFVYCVAAVVTTWPLVLHPSATLGAPVGPGDPFLNLWVLGWGMQAFVSDPGAVLTGRVFDANIFHPAGGTLAYSDHLLLQSGLLAPLYALTDDVVLCYNVLLIGSLVGSALAMHVFARYVTASRGGAYLAGLAWGFGSYRFAHLLHIQLQSLYFLPLTLLFLHRLVAGRRRWDAVVLGLLYGLQAVSSVYYAIIGGFALVTGGLALVWTTGGRRVGIVARRCVLAVAVASVLVLPIGIAYWHVQQEEGFGRNLYQAAQGAAFLDSYLQVPPGNVMYGRTGLLRSNDESSGSGPPRTGAERELFPGVVLVALAVVGAGAGFRGRARALVVSMIVIGALGLVLSLGPEGVRPLYAALHRHLFGFQAIRAPARFSVLVLCALSILGALGWQAVVTRARRAPITAASRAALPLLVVLATLEWLHIPTALADAPASRTAVGEWLRQAPGTGAVAVLPLQIDVESTAAMVQSLEHRRPLVNGYSGQRPAFYPALVDTLSTFPSAEAFLALREVDVQYIVARDLDPVPTPLVARARFSEATIYELRWTPEVSARLGGDSPIPPPAGPIPFRPGERARYAVAWAGGGADLVAGEIAIDVEAPPYRFVVTATTAPWVAKFFEARDVFATTTDEQLFPRIHERDQDEGSRRVVRTIVYDHAAGVVRLGRTMDEARGADAVTLPLAAHARDAIAALFYARTLPLETGARYRVPVNEAGRNVVVDIRVAGREMIDVQGESVEAVRLDPTIERRVERRRPPRATMWVSADARRVPLAFDVEATFGRIRLELTRYQSPP